MSQGVGRWFNGVRGLWESLSLGQEPNLALIMVQAPPVDDEVMTFLFDLVARATDGGVGATRDQRLAGLAARHSMVNIDDAGERHLSEKLLGERALLTDIRAVLPNAPHPGQGLPGLSGYPS